jgi:hypothetical protein
VPTSPCSRPCALDSEYRGQRHQEADRCWQARRVARPQGARTELKVLDPLPGARPRTRNRQGNDVGASRRSAIYYTDDEQKRVALDTIADVNASGLWPGDVVLEVEPVGPFWEAEPEHQDYLEKYRNGYTCHFVRPNLKLPHRSDAAHVGS